MHTVGLGSRGFGVVPDPPVHIGVADGIPNIMAKVTAKIGKPLFLLLTGRDFVEVAQASSKKVLDMVFMHIRSDIPVVPVP